MNRKKSIQMAVYYSNLGISTIAMVLVAAMEIFMLCYSVVNVDLYGSYLLRYRGFYIALLAMSLVYISLNLYVKKDLERRYGILNVSNPVCALFFFLWTLGITYSDVRIGGVVDPTVYMTSSLIIPLSFYMYPVVYALAVLIADGIMMYLSVTITGSEAQVINLSIFFIFQLVLGVTFMHMRTRIAESIIAEMENAKVDVLTGRPNRRRYEEDIKKLSEEKLPADLVYMVVDINALKNTNDTLGHEAGDRLIIATADCIEETLGKRGSLYRIGGDEFVVLLRAALGELKELIGAYEVRAKNWSDENGITLSTSYGYVCHIEFPEKSITDLAKVADDRMYEDKARYYQLHGNNRRR